MTSPSDIPNHPLVQMLDYQGDAFPAGSSFFIKNLCSRFRQTLAFNHNVQGAVTRTAQADADCKWLVHYENNDRSKVAFQSAHTGQYLAATNPRFQASMGLSEQVAWWWVYQGGAPGTYWFSSAQMKDCFLHTWDCSKNEGSLVASFTNRDPQAYNFYNAPYSVLDEWTTGMSWALDPTPELMQWKEQQKAQPQSEQCEHDTEGLSRREQDLEEKERQVQGREADLHRREQAFQKKTQDFEKSYDELKKREEAAQAAEERIKKSKKGGKADLLATQEEKDKLQADLKNVQDQLASAKETITQLKEQSQQVDGSRVASNKSSSFAFSIRSPEMKHPQQKLPALKTPARKIPGAEQPGKSLPSGYNSGLLKRFEAGKLAMSSQA